MTFTAEQYQAGRVKYEARMSSRSGELPNGYAMKAFDDLDQRSKDAWAKAAKAEAAMQLAATRKLL
jgi:hypothetical protein